jgi:hypothetical protein
VFLEAGQAFVAFTEKEGLLSDAGFAGKFLKSEASRLVPAVIRDRLADLSRELDHRVRVYGWRRVERALLADNLARMVAARAGGAPLDQAPEEDALELRYLPRVIQA